MLDHISGGRLEIGLARGSNPIEVETIGIPSAEMQPRFLEALDIVEGALTATEPFNYDGKFYKCHNLTVNPRPLQLPLPPRWISVVSPESCALAARRGYKVCGGFYPPSASMRILMSTVRPLPPPAAKSVRRPRHSSVGHHR